MTDRVALVTGASRGAGAGIAKGLGELGYTVYVTGRTITPGDAKGWDGSVLPGTVAETDPPKAGTDRYFPEQLRKPPPRLLRAAAKALRLFAIIPTTHKWQRFLSKSSVNKAVWICW